MENNTQFEIETLFNPSALRDELQVRSLPQNTLLDEDAYWNDRAFGFVSDSSAACLKKATEALWAKSGENEEGYFSGDGVSPPREKSVAGESDGVSVVDETPVLLRGDEIGDAPTQYHVAGLRKGELPVIGTYVDRRIVPGFSYKVRVLDSRRHMFEGRALPLLQIGKGYGKRITFKGDSHNGNQNYLWSDSNPEGCAFSLVAIERGDRFSIYDELSRPVGMAVVGAVESHLEVCTQVSSDDGAIRKQVRVTFACEVQFGGQPHGLMSVCSESVVQASGVALLVKGKGQREAKVEAVEGVDLPFHGPCILYKEE